MTSIRSGWRASARPSWSRRTAGVPCVRRLLPADEAVVGLWRCQGRRPSFPAAPRHPRSPATTCPHPNPCASTARQARARPSRRRGRVRAARAALGRAARPRLPRRSRPAPGASPASSRCSRTWPTTRLPAAKLPTSGQNTPTAWGVEPCVPSSSPADAAPARTRCSTPQKAARPTKEMRERRVSASTPCLPSAAAGSGGRCGRTSASDASPAAESLRLRGVVPRKLIAHADSCAAARPPAIRRARKGRRSCGGAFARHRGAQPRRPAVVPGIARAAGGQRPCRRRRPRTRRRPRRG